MAFLVSAQPSWQKGGTLGGSSVRELGCKLVNVKAM